MSFQTSLSNYNLKNIWIANELAFFTSLLYIFFTLPILPMSSAKPSVKVMLPQEMQMLLFVWNALTTYTSLNCFRKDAKSSERQKAMAVVKKGSKILKEKFIKNLIPANMFFILIVFSRSAGMVLDRR